MSVATCTVDPTASEITAVGEPSTGVVSTTTQFEVLRYDELVEKIAKLNRKAAKLGVAAMTLTVHSRRFITFDKFGRKKPFDIDAAQDVLGNAVCLEAVTCSLSGETPRLGGYSFIGRIDRSVPSQTKKQSSSTTGRKAGSAQTSSGIQLVMTVPGETMPEKYRTVSQPVCEHCNLIRRRNDTYIVRNDATGEHMEIGRNCLADFLSGRDPEMIIAAMQYLKAAMSAATEDEEGGFFGGRGDPSVMVEPLLAMTSAVIRAYGWCSREEARNDFTGMKTATSSLVREQIFSRRYIKPADRITPDERDREIAAATIGWVQDVIAVKTQQTEYDHNLAALVRVEAIPAAKLGLVASAVAGYQRWLGQQVQYAYERKQKLNSVHFGNAGERLTVQAVAVRTRNIESRFGVKTICNFITTEGNVMVWFAAGDIELIPGRTYSVKATIKNHDTYQGVAQTVVARAVFTLVEEKETPSLV